MNWSKHDTAHVTQKQFSLLRPHSYCRGFMVSAFSSTLWMLRWLYCLNWAMVVSISTSDGTSTLETCIDSEFQHDLNGKHSEFNVDVRWHQHSER